MKIIYYFYKDSESNRIFTNFSDFFNYFKDWGVIRIKRSEFCLSLISLLFYALIYKKDLKETLSSHLQNYTYGKITIE